MKTSQITLTDVDVLGGLPRYKKVDKKEVEIEEIRKEEVNVKALAYSKERSLASTYSSKVIQRFIDILAGIVGVIILLILTPIVWLANKILKEDGPIFYSQERIGKDGKIFKMYKYRSMVVGADQKLKEYLKENKEAAKEYKKYKKLKNDPRITKMGKILRKTSLDEMPQLLNVLNGTMSLVGPRPYLPREQEEMGDYYNIIIKDTPGITGLWQVNGRSNTSFNERLDMDIMYHKNKSIKNNIVILVKTFLNVFKKEGAI